MAPKLDRIREMNKQKAAERATSTEAAVPAAPAPAGASAAASAKPPLSGGAVPGPQADTSLSLDKSAKSRQEHQERLPHGSRFDVTYDAVAVSWKGSLMVPDCPDFTSSATGVFKLLSRLDSLYRAWKKSEGSAEAKEGEAPG
ncbi:MAG TPA: hypothetical protein VNX28_14780 [Gemmataceae bacterium]|jgi:hypothetical protein|nr:hypothetical protein [Gemmataceae bacterium]